MTFHWSGTLNLSSTWWLSGGILPSNCIIAYAPKGAFNITDSYINLSNPGYYDATVGVVPTWDATNGWKFNGSTQYLLTGWTTPGVPTHSMFVRFSNVGNAGYMCGVFGGSPLYFFSLLPKSGSNQYFGNSGETGYAGAATSGVIGFAGSTAYQNGTSKGAIGTSAGTYTAVVPIGCRKQTVTFGEFCSVYIQAFAIYNTAITAAQVTALTNAMNAL